MRVFQAEQVNVFSYMGVINSTEKDINLLIPPIKMEPCHEIDYVGKKLDYLDPDIDSDRAAAERLKTLDSLSALAGLNDEEKLSIISVV